MLFRSHSPPSTAPLTGPTVLPPQPPSQAPAALPPQPQGSTCSYSGSMPTLPFPILWGPVSSAPAHAPAPPWLCLCPSQVLAQLPVSSFPCLQTILRYLRGAERGTKESSLVLSPAPALGSSPPAVPPAVGGAPQCCHVALQPGDRNGSVQLVDHPSSWSDLGSHAPRCQRNLWELGLQGKMKPSSPLTIPEHFVPTTAILPRYPNPCQIPPSTPPPSCSGQTLNYLRAGSSMEALMPPERMPLESVSYHKSLCL